MRITCFIENLGAGGAERQMAQLASLLKTRGHQVSLLVYHSADHYRGLLEQHQIPITKVVAKRGLPRALAVRRAILADRPDLVIAFKIAPSVYAELSGIPRRNYALIVSERNHNYRGPSLLVRARFALHALADAVVCNSQAQTDLLRHHAPWLRTKTHTITNCVDLQRFRPSQELLPEGSHGRNLKLLVLARLAPQKNAFRLVAAIARLRLEQPDLQVLVNWYGSYRAKEPLAEEYYQQVSAKIKERHLEDCFRFHDAQQDVLPLFASHDAICLPSLYEGCSNAVGEALACGKPVLASRAGDNGHLVENGVNGFLFDALDVESIREAIQRFADLSEGERFRFGESSRERAERLLSPARFIEQYDQLARSVVERHRKSRCRDLLDFRSQSTQADVPAVLVNSDSRQQRQSLRDRKAG